MNKTLEQHQRPRRTMIILENVSAPADQRMWAEAMALYRAGYEVSVICPKRRRAEPSEEIVDGIRVFRHPLPFRSPSFLGKLFEIPFALFWEFVLSIKIARRYGFDVVHICNPPNIIFLIGAIYKIIAKKKVVFDYRDGNPKRRKGKISDHGSLVERLAFKTAALSLAINESHREIAIRRGRMPAEKALVLRPCPDLDRLAPTRPNPLWRNGRVHMVAYAGEVSKAQGLDLFLSAIEYIVHEQQHSDIHFVIAGGDPDWREIASLCAKMDLSDYVTFTGPVDDETLCTILSTADLCVDPRRVNSGGSISTSQKIMEYMAIGKPIVQFDTAENQSVAQEASLYARKNDPVDFGNQILVLIDSIEMRTAMGKFGRLRVREELCWQHEQKKLLSAYDTLFSMRSRRQNKNKTSGRRIS